jgi:hypothetical protein
MGFELPVLPPPVAAQFEVHPENWATVEMFLRLQTQWRSTMSGVIGLDYSAAQWLFRLYEVQDQRALLEDLQTMEVAAMQVINKPGG